MNTINNLKELPKQGQLFRRKSKSRSKGRSRLGSGLRNLGSRIGNTVQSRGRSVLSAARERIPILDEGLDRAEEIRNRFQRQAAAFRGARFERPAPKPIERAPVDVQDPITGGAIAEETIESIKAEAVADYIQQQENRVAVTNGGKTFQIFNADEVNGDIIEATKETVTAGLWSDNLTELQSYFTQSMTATQLPYYVNVLQKEEGATGSAIQYAVAYGNRLGSGSFTEESLDDSPTRAIYSQYAQLLLPKDISIFTDPASGSADSIYVINFQRNRTKDKLDPGNFELPLVPSADNAPDNATGSNLSFNLSDGEKGAITLIDDSTITSASNEDAGNVYHLVSGSIARGVYNPASPEYYGTVYVDHSTIVLNGDTLDNELNFQTNLQSNSQGTNHLRLHGSISASFGLAANGFKARNKETVSSTFYFVRVKNGDFNYSNNPTYVTGSEGDIKEDEFIGDPKAYITTVGLYDDSRQLLAIAKLSKPLLKSKKRELNIRVKLEY